MRIQVLFRQISRTAALMAVSMPALVSGANTDQLPLTDTSRLVAHGVQLSPAEYRGRKAIRVLQEKPGLAYAEVQGVPFRDGTIEVDIAVKITRPDLPTPGFAGVIFRAAPDIPSYELFYLRPRNATSLDQLKRNHSVQYVSPPEHEWYALRYQWPSVYESHAVMEPEQWTPVKVEVVGRMAKLYVGTAEQPSLIVDGLKGRSLTGGIALWGFPNQETYFSNLRVTHAAPAPVQNGSEVSGEWNVRLDTDRGAFDGVMRLQREGSNVSGDWSGALGEKLAVAGTWRDGYVDLRFTGQLPDGPGKTITAPVVLAGWIDGSTARGNVRMDGLAGGAWAAKQSGKGQS